MQRRLGLALVLFFLVSGANARWQKKYPVVKYGVIPVETQTGTTKTMDGFSSTRRRRPASSGSFTRRPTTRGR